MDQYHEGLDTNNEATAAAARAAAHRSSQPLGEALHLTAVAAWLSARVQGMNSPDHRADLEKKMSELKEDPELAPILEEIEKGGPATMMKYWNDPRVLGKLGKVRSHLPLLRQPRGTLASPRPPHPRANLPHSRAPIYDPRQTWTFYTVEKRLTWPLVQ